MTERSGVVPSVVHVVAGTLFDSQQRVLIAQRPPGKHMAGGWEFPGGKVNAGEQPIDALARELHEELGVTVHGAEPLIAYEHAYADRVVLLDLWHVTRYQGEPYSREGQQIKWVAVDSLPNADLLEADRPMIGALQALAKKL
jgi:8-oxo-dGTP diphosphatase